MFMNMKLYLGCAILKSIKLKNCLNIIFFPQNYRSVNVTVYENNSFPKSQN